MSPEDILSHPAKVLEPSQRQFYFEQGYLALPAQVGHRHLSVLRTTLAEVVEQSRSLTRSNGIFDLEDGHCAEHPRLRRAVYLDDHYDVLWDLCSNSIVTDIAEDILGPDVRFRDLMMNFKWSGGGAEVKWHQDLAFYPHTNTATCQFLLALEDIGPEQGPLQVIPGSHKGPIYAHYDSEENWTGAISDSDMRQAGIDSAIALTGPAGSLTVHHGCCIHGSDKNLSQNGRPVFVMTYAAADAIPYTAAPYASSHYGVLVRGRQPLYAHHEALYMPLPPDWSQGYTSIFEHQQKNQ